MGRKPLLAIAVVTAAAGLGACGSSGSTMPPCMVLSNGNQLCGNAAVAWCELNNVGTDTTDYPVDSSTHQACVSASNWADKGKVINVTPNSNGNGLNETTVTAP